MSSTNGHSTGGVTAVAGARPVVLLRYRPGVAEKASRVVHVVPLPVGGERDAAGVALCGALLCLDQVETVLPGHGAPCNLCMVNHLSASCFPPSVDAPFMAPPAGNARSDIGPLAAAVCYRVWGWPVTLRGEQVWLNLEPNPVALIMPASLAGQVTEILYQRRCPPLVLVSPDRPEHRVVLAGEPYGVGLPWPPGVHRAKGILPLPPTKTARGPVTWVHPPEAQALRLCREVDVFAALRTVLRNPPM